MISSTDPLRTSEPQPQPLSPPTTPPQDDPLASLPFGDYFMAVLRNFSGVKKGQLEGKITDLQSRNAVLKRAQDAMAAARMHAEHGWVHEPPVYTNFIEAYGIPRDTYGGDKKHNKQEWNINLQNIQGWVDAYNADTQIKTTDMQRTMNDFNQISDMMTSILNKIDKVKNTAVNNSK